MTAIQGVMSEDDAEPKVPPGVLLEGPLVDAKVREIRLMFAILYGGTAAALIWVVTQGIGWVEIAVFAGMYLLTMFGMGAGMHRLLVHRSFRCGPVMRAFFCMIGTMAMQGSVLRWVSNHRRHHLYADKPGDVHSPQYDGVGNRYLSYLKGMMHAQGGWVFDQATTQGEYYAKDILADPIAMFFVRTRWFWYLTSIAFIPAAIGYAAGGIHTMIGCVLFSGLFRNYVTTTMTSLVNSVCHSEGRYGYRRFEINDGTTNQFLVSILTLGEGLHNNHHRFPRDAYISHAWYEIDITGLIIRGLGKLGLVQDIFEGGAQATRSGNAEGGQRSMAEQEAEGCEPDIM